MSFLKKFWLPLLLTVLSGATYPYFEYHLVTAIVLSVTAIAWIVFAYLQSSVTAPVGQRASVEQHALELAASIRERIFSIVKSVNRFIDEEVEVLNESLEQIERLAKDAVTTLSHSLRSLNHQVHTQSKLLHELAGISVRKTVAEDDDGPLSVGQYIEDSQSVIQYFLDLLDELSEQRGQMSEAVQQARTYVEELAKRMDTSAGSAEARLTLSRLKIQIQRQRDNLERSRSWVQERTDADLAISRMESTREKLRAMRDVVAMNVEAFTAQSSIDVGKAVRSLQFEDIVTQLVGDAQYRLDEMNLLVSVLNARADRIKVVDDGNHIDGALEVVLEIQSDAEARIKKMRALRQKPVGQRSMDEGSVELF